jgi:hypothetical protein
VSAVETRAQALLGTRSTRRLETSTRSALTKARKLIEGVGHRWGEIDAVLSEEMDALCSTIDTALDPGGVLEECIEHLHEPWGGE